MLENIRAALSGCRRALGHRSVRRRRGRGEPAAGHRHAGDRGRPLALRRPAAASRPGAGAGGSAAGARAARPDDRRRLRHRSAHRRRHQRQRAQVARRSWSRTSPALLGITDRVIFIDEGRVVSATSPRRACSSRMPTTRSWCSHDERARPAADRVAAGETRAALAQAAADATALQHLPDRDDAAGCQRRCPARAADAGRDRRPRRRWPSALLDHDAGRRALPGCDRSKGCLRSDRLRPADATWARRCLPTCASRSSTGRCGCRWRRSSRQAAATLPRASAVTSS